MSNNALDARRKDVLKFDYWMCRLCETKIDAGSAVGSDDEKTSILSDHVHRYHFDDRNIDPNLEDKYLVIYFKGHSNNIGT